MKNIIKAWLGLIFLVSTAHAVDISRVPDAPYRAAAYGIVADNPQQAVAAWWDRYKRQWNVEPYGTRRCSFTSTWRQPTIADTRVVTMRLTGQCTGGNYVYATLTCPSGYSLVSGRCRPNGQPVAGKNDAAECPRAGNPINVMLGIKYQQETDYTHHASSMLEFKRFYTSGNYLSDRHTMKTWRMGTWRTSYSRHLEIDMTGQPATVQVIRDSGQRFFFVLDGQQWVSSADVTLQFTEEKDVDGVTIGWTLINNRDQVERYNAAGYLLSVEDPVAGSLYLTYENGFLRTLADSFGNELQFHTDILSGTLQSLTDPQGNVIHYVTNGHVGNITEVIFPDPATEDLESLPRRLYHYENSAFPGALTGITNERGIRYVTWAYDAQGRATGSIYADAGDQAELDYSQFNHASAPSVTVTSALGKQTTYHLTTINGVRKVSQVEGHPSANCAGANQDYQYNASGHITSKTNWNGVATHYVRDGKGRELSRTEAVGTPQQRTITTQWHSQFDKPVRVTRPGVMEEYDYWPNQRLRRVIRTDTTDQQTHFGSTQGQQRIREYHYTYHQHPDLPADAQVATMTVIGPLLGEQDRTTYHYAPGGQLTAVINALGHETRFADFNGRGQPQTVIDANGVITELSYHPRGWLLETRVRAPAGSPTPEGSTRYDWYADGKLRQTTMADGSFLHYTYNDAGHVIEVRNNLDEAVQYEPNPVGEWIRATTRDASGNITRLQQRAFDELGRLKDLLGANGQHSQFSYDPEGNRQALIQHGDDQPLTTMLSHDALNRLETTFQQVRTAQQGETAHVAVETRFDYDAAGNLITVTDPKGYATHYVYNGFGERIRQHSPDTGVTDYAFNANGNRIGQRDAAGVEITYHYDLLGRLIRTAYPDSSEDVFYYYDETDIGGPFAIGRLTRIVDAHSTISYRYDHLGNITEDRRTSAGQTWVTQYAYNAMGQLTGITYPSGRSVTFQRDNAGGRISDIVTAGQGEAAHSVVSQVRYLPFGPAYRLVYGNGVIRQMSFDQDYRLQRIRDDGIATLKDRQYGYDPFDNITAIFNNLHPERDQSFVYDDLHRLQQAHGAYARGAAQLHYEYDPVGNRLRAIRSGDHQSVQAEDYQYQSDSHQLTSVIRQDGTSRTLSHSAAGHLAAETTFAGQARRYDYNAAQRLVGVSEANWTARYHYNALGQRIRKEVSGTSTDPTPGQLNAGLERALSRAGAPLAAALAKRDARRSGPADDTSTITASSTVFIYGLQGQLLGEYRDDGTPLREYLHADGTPLMMVHYTADEAALYWYHTDHLGTPQALTDRHGQIAWQAQYDPFGEVVLLVNNVTQPLRFPGQYFDEETGLHYNYFRDYDPGTGRYVQSDPIGLDGGISTYGYAYQNPVLNTDPLGLFVRTLQVRPSAREVQASPGAACIICMVQYPKLGVPVEPTSSNVIDFPGGSNQGVDSYEECLPDDGCRKRQRALNGEKAFMFDFWNSSAGLVDYNQRKMAYQNWVMKFNRRVAQHNLGCPNYKVSPVSTIL